MTGEYSPGSGVSAFEAAVKRPMSAAEIMTFRCLQTELSKSDGDLVRAGTQVLASHAVSRRILNLAHQLSSRLKVAFVTVGDGIAPLWLAADGLHVTIYETEKNLVQLSQLRARFFEATEDPKDNTEIGVLRLRSLSDVVEKPVEKERFDLVWLGPGAPTENVRPILRWARRVLIQSDVGLLASVANAQGDADRNEALRDAASGAHMKRLAHTPIALFRPFEILDDTVPNDLVTDIPRQPSGISRFGAQDLHRLLGLPALQPPADSGLLERFVEAERGAAP